MSLATPAGSIALVWAAAASAVAVASPAAAQQPPAGVPADTGTPAVTLLYQNFPNPFPSAESRTTCIWFDLNLTAAVSLTVHDVRGHLVRRLLPNAATPQVLTPGRYGRASPAAGTGCDPVLTWDGRADDGSVVPRGVYLVRLRAGRTQAVKKAVFQGP